MGLVDRKQLKHPFAQIPGYASLVSKMFILATKLEERGAAVKHIHIIGPAFTYRVGCKLPLGRPKPTLTMSVLA